MFYLQGRWYRQHYVNTHPAGIHEGAFFHFQTWKRQYKTLAYGSPELPALRGGRHWRASPEGLLPVVAPDGALDRGLNLSEGGLLTG